MKRLPLLMGSAIAIALLTASEFCKPETRLVYNPTDSAPRGWYWVIASPTFRVDDYVIATLPDDVAALAARRNYLPLHLPILKRIGALAPQSICIRQNIVRIDGIASAYVLASDAKGRVLQPWRPCRRLKSDEVFLFSPAHPASFDSRYFGPVTMSAVRGKALPLWTWNYQ